MKESTDPVGPAFAEASNENAALRARRIAALTPAQRQIYERRAQDEQTKQNEHRRELEKNWSRDVEKEKSRLKDGKSRLEFTPPFAKGMSDTKAEELARGRVNQRASAAMEQVSKDSQKRLDGYLEQAEQERDRQAQSQTQERSAKPAGQEFNANARDPALKRAFDRARDRNDGQELQQNRSRETAEGRDNGVAKARDETLKRAFEQARQREETRNRDLGHQR